MKIKAKKLIMTMLITCVMCVAAHANSATNAFWSVAKPAGNLKGALGGSEGAIFQFTTPAAGNMISLSVKFSAGVFSPAICNNRSDLLPTPARTYSNVCIDSAHANKIYYIDQTSLYFMAEVLGTDSISQVRCANLVSSDLSIVGRAITCSNINHTCSLPASVGNLGVLPSEGSC